MDEPARVRIPEGAGDLPSKLNGLFAVSYYKPKGAVWERVRLDRCDTRKEAKQRALRFYYEHSPKKAARHGWTGDGYA